MALQRDEHLRQKFYIDTSLYEPEMIFLGTDQRDHVRHHGYGQRGMRLQKQTMLVRGKRVNSSVYGLLDVHTRTTCNMRSISGAGVGAFVLPRSACAIAMAAPLTTSVS